MLYYAYKREGDIVKKYPIQTPGIDFVFTKSNTITKGTRVKKIVIDNKNEKAFSNMKSIQ